MSSNTLCGRPARTTYSMFSTQAGHFGDINYGYVTNCTAETSPTCEVGYSGVDGTSCIGTPQSGQKIGSAACSSAASSCDYGVFGSRTYLCQSNWDGPLYTANKVNCCAGLATSSDVCAPETCAAGVTTNDAGNGCHATMKAFCTPANWINNAVVVPGLSTAVQGQVACDTYVNTVPQDIIVEGNYNSSQAVIRNAIQQYYAPSSGNNPKTPKDAFAQKAVVLARQYPGLVDDILTNVCSQYKRSDLTVQPPTQFDPNGTNLIQTCGCFLPASEYYTDPQTNVACDTLCAYPGAIPKGNGQGAALQCGGTTCVINNVAIDLLNSNGGSIDFSQVCGNCQSSGTSSGPCRCLFGDNSVSVIGNGSIAGVQVSDKCGECFSMTQNSDGTFALTKVDCGSVPPPVPPNGGGGNIFTDIGAWISSHIILSIGIVIAVVVVIFVVVILIVYAERKKGRTR